VTANSLMISFLEQCNRVHVCECCTSCTTTANSRWRMQWNSMEPLSIRVYKQQCGDYCLATIQIHHHAYSKTRLPEKLC